MNEWVLSDKQTILNLREDNEGLVLEIERLKRVIYGLNFDHSDAAQGGK
jgi:hypothetical protein